MIETLRVTYVLTSAEGEDPEAKARDIAYEQTVELPAGCVTADVERSVVGRVEQLRPLEGGRREAVISFPLLAAGDDATQLFNLLFGNISLKSGIRITNVEWPASLLRRFAGPWYGIDGLRWLCKVSEPRPLVCGALKPMGLATDALARLCFQLASGGVDIVKDDHGLVDQSTAPFRERVGRCQQAVAEANEKTGGSSVYFPNLTGAASDLEERLTLARDAGCRGILLSPLLAGPDTVSHIADRFEFAILAHPAMAGAYFADDHGIAPELLLGDLFRLIGSDGVIYPNVGGRFPFTEQTCAAINTRLRQPLGALRPVFPVPGGGIEVARVPHWIERYGTDTIFLIGGSLYSQPDLVTACRDLLEAVSAVD